MQIVIDIPEEIMEYVKNNGCLSVIYTDEVAKAIINGRPLPKGHGRLMILSEDTLKENQINLDFSCMKWISEIGVSNATIAMIEADNAESEE